MEAQRFDTLTRMFTGLGSRRTLLRGVLSSGLIATLGGVPPQSVAAAGQPTATCQATSNALTVVGGNDRLAQTFRAGVSGKLVRVELFLSAEQNADDDLVVQIAKVVRSSGAPSNDILAATTVPSATLPVNTAGTVVATFGRQVAADVVAGKRYAIILKRKGSSNLFVPIRNDDPCQDGALFSSESGTAPFAPLGIGNIDLVFTAFVAHA